MADFPLALKALDVAPRTRKSNYPPEFARRVEGREKRQLGDQFGLKSFGVNLTVLKPGGQSALMHRHEIQDEFIYILDGSPDLLTDQGSVRLGPGMCAGFPAKGVAHHLANNSETDVTYLEIGDRQRDDSATYPQDDLVALADPEKGWVFTRKDGTPY
ncbi:MAG: cupin domain-containing protein [Hyphomicrobiaceae bacterium]|nr:cupin domain-containing protein [Hyphomicrobiaceae bacterium]MCC0024675.1 cupin domain-containing protein [Hyphomicrobiaceae bacterium]